MKRRKKRASQPQEEEKVPISTQRVHFNAPNMRRKANNTSEEKPLLPRVSPPQVGGGGRGGGTKRR